MALDLSLTATGWAVSPSDPLTAAAHGVEKGGEHLDGAERLSHLHRWLNALNAAHAPDVAVIEGYSYASNLAYAREHAEWVGVARVTLWHRAVPVVDIPPKTLKKFATGNGNAPKGDMRMALFKRATLDVSDDNEVDALWLLAAGHHVAGDPLWPMPKSNAAAVERVAWPAGVRG